MGNLTSDGESRLCATLRKTHLLEARSKDFA